MYHGQSKQALQRKQNIGAKFKPAVILRLHQVCLTLSGAILRKTFLPPPNAKIDHLGTIKFLIIIIVINNIVHFKATISFNQSYLNLKPTHYLQAHSS